MTDTATHAAYEVVDQLDEQQLGQLHALFDREWWTQGRTREEVESIVANSQVNVCLVDRETRELVGYLRVLTDFRFFAVILDVIVDEDRRGEGLGRVLMDATMDHPQLQQLKGIGLQCEAGLVDFYRRWGFDDTVGRTRQMKRVFEGR